MASPSCLDPRWSNAMQQIHLGRERPPSSLNSCCSNEMKQRHLCCMRPPSCLDPCSCGMPRNQVIHCQILTVPHLCKHCSSAALKADCGKGSTSLPSSRHTLHNDDIDNIKLIRHLGEVSPPIGLDSHCAVFHLLNMIPCLDASPPRLNGNYTWQSIHSIIDRQMHSYHTLHNCNTVQVLKDMHGCQISTNNTLNLCSTVVIVLQTIACEPSTESSLYLNSWPDSDF